jgi:hypothetical protein
MYNGLIEFGLVATSYLNSVYYLLIQNIERIQNVLSCPNNNNYFSAWSSFRIKRTFYYKQKIRTNYQIWTIFDFKNVPYKKIWEE